MNDVLEILNVIDEAEKALPSLRFPWYEPERRTPAEASAQASLFGASRRAVDRFHSGSSAYWDCRGFILAGVPVGITATALPKQDGGKLLDLVAAYTGRGGLAFVDSGAFGAFVAGERLDFERDVFPAYDELVRRCALPGQLRLVMPDVVGNPVASMELQQRHAGRIRGWIASGAHCIFPLHSPNDSAFLEAIEAVTAGMPYTVGVPSNLEAWSFAELQRFCAAHKPARIHMLGLGQPKKVEAVAEGVAEVSPDTAISCDSCTLLAHVGHGRRLTDRCQTRLADAVEWIIEDPTAQVPYPDLSTYVCNLLDVPNYLAEADVRRLAQRFELDADELLEAGSTEGLGAVLWRLDPDEQWFHRELAIFARDELLRPKLERVLRGPIRAWEVARVAGMADEELGEVVE